MEINLPREQQEFIQGLIASGRFATIDEVIVESVRALEGTERLRHEIEIGIQAADTEDVLEHDVVFDELRRLASQTDSSHGEQ